ncbi:hypothetical protein JT358_09575 [Micrococcales bacterium 31B]|nr:hypothetical protein [Micrococcales bacterium 31B]
MKFAQSKQSWLRATVAATALLAAVAGTATVASAASVGISGTVYNNQT